jgi:hypothetical protein
MLSDRLSSLSLSLSLVFSFSRGTAGERKGMRGSFDA